MTRLMFDSTSANDIPGNAEIVAGYVDGLFKWSDDDWSKFPNATKVRIAVFASTNDGEVLDVEQGNATPYEARSWLLMRQANGVSIPTIYCNRSTIGAVIASCTGLAFKFWIATLDGTQEVPGAAAVQYAGEAITGHHYDESIVYDDNWPTQNTAPETSLLNIQEENMGARFIITPPPDAEPTLGDIQHVAHVDVAGQLWATWQASNPFGWHPQQIATGLMSLSPVDIYHDTVGKQLHITAVVSDGHPVHAWLDLTLDPNKAVWGVEHPGW